MPGIWNIVLRRRPSDTPKALWEFVTAKHSRIARCVFWSAFLGAAGIVVAIFAHFFFVYNTNWHTILGGSGILAFFAAASLNTRYHKEVNTEFRRYLEKHDRLICIQCGYFLKGFHSDPLICSECGAKNTRHELNRYWRQNIQSTWFEESR